MFLLPFFAALIILILTPLKHSEAELVGLLKQKDENAFSNLYDNYSGSLYGIVLKILNGDAELSKDALQDAFIKIWKNIDSYEASKGTLFTWMLNIARNTAIDKLRSIRRVAIQPLAGNVHIVEENSNNSIGENKIGVKAEVSKLKPEYKEVIDLAYFGGYTQEEISETLNIPLGTVKTRTRAALIELRKIFK